MNKKFVLLLIPLMLIPLISYGYAHFTDQVIKKYKVHVGSLEIDVTGFHVDKVIMPDVNQDGKLFHEPSQAGDELMIKIYENADDCTWYVEIIADPITGGFILDTTMWLHNAGKLPFELHWDVFWDGPYDDDPCFLPPGPIRPLTELDMPPWSWEMTVDRWYYDEATGAYVKDPDGPFAPTQVHYKPCDYIEVKQHINFEQPDSAKPESATWQKDWECKWIRLWVTFTAWDITMEDESWTWGTLGPVP